jgi:hypothetical protein
MYQSDAARTRSIYGSYLRTGTRLGVEVHVTDPGHEFLGRGDQHHDSTNSTTVIFVRMKEAVSTFHKPQSSARSIRHLPPADGHYFPNDWLPLFYCFFTLPQKVFTTKDPTILVRFQSAFGV